MAVRGDLEMHPRHFIYFFSGAFSGLTLNYFINKILFSEDTLFSEATHLGEAVFYVLTVLGIFAGLSIDNYMVKHRHQIDRKRFLQIETLTMIAFHLLIAMLLCFTLQYQI